MSDETQSTSEVASVLPEVEAHSNGAGAYQPDAGSPQSFVDEHPGAAVGAAFLGGLVLAQLIRKRGDD